MKHARSLWILLSVVLTFSIITPGFAQDGPQPGYAYNLAEYEALTGQPIDTFNESPLLEERIAAGELPPIEERLPDNPLVMEPWNEIGEYGGMVRWDEIQVGYDTYCRHLFYPRTLLFPLSETYHYNSGVSGPARPFILESWESNEDATEYTLTNRNGMKWSDGTPVTTEDVRYRIEDVLLNEEISPVLPLWLRWNPERSGLTTQLEVVDDYTFQIKFAMPYGTFINSAFRDGSWSGWFSPSHFLKQYHKDYGDMEEILAVMDEKGFEGEEQWPNFYNAIESSALGDAGGYIDHPFNTTIPVLYPWVVKEAYDDGSVLFERNPYFFVIDPEGNQLPYLDYMRRQFISDLELENLDIIAGNVDVQTIYIRISDFPLYKENEDEGNYNALTKKAWQHHVLIYWLNPSVADPQLNAALSQVEFRRALSIALDREFINESVFLGLGTPAQFAPPQGTPIESEELTNFAAEYDPEGAMQILDELGYIDVDDDGWREDPEGNDFIFPIQYYEVTPVADQGAQIAEEYWEAIGINTNVQQLDGGTFWEYQGANEVASAIWWANGPDFRDVHFIGFNVSAQGWDIWHDTGGEEGIEPPDWVKRIWEIQDERLMVASDDERWALDAEGWDLATKHITTIGTVEGAKNPLILNKGLGNVEYGFDKDFVPQSFLEAAFQWYFTDPARREVNP